MTEELWKHVFICFYPDLSDRSGLEKKTKPTSFPREYTSSAFCHILDFPLNNHIWQKQTCCCIPCAGNNCAIVSRSGYI